MRDTLQKIASPNRRNLAAVSIGIQKRDGKLFNLSLRYLCDLGVEVDAEAGKKGREVLSATLRWGDCAALVTCPIDDIIKNVAAGFLDFGIISNDVLRKWETVKKETATPSAIFVLKDLGPAGSRLMLGIDGNFIDKTICRPLTDIGGPAKGVWKKAMQASYKRDLPVVTSDKPALTGFLMRNQIRFKPRNIMERRGAVEAQGRIMGAVVICDLVQSGDTMRSCGYEPAGCATISQSRMLLIGNEPQPSDKRTAEFGRQAQSVSICIAPV